VEAHLDIQGVLEDIVANGAVEELFDLSEEGKIHGGRLIWLVKDFSRLACHLVEVQVLYMWLEFKFNLEKYFKKKL
jgi:hypothetical protein